MTAVDAAPLTDAVVAARLTGDRCVILLDVDGTLAPIAPRPEDAVVPAATRAAVARLTQCRGTIVGLVSGRAAADARRMVDVPELWTIGNHGAETIAPDGTAFVHPDVAAAAPAVATARADLEAEIAGVPGAHVENKRWSLSVHVRLTPPNSPQASSRSRSASRGTVDSAPSSARRSLSFAPPLESTKGPPPSPWWNGYWKTLGSRLSSSSAMT